MQVELTQMPYGDVAWVGVGVDGMPSSVGVEMKSIHDCIACIQSGRFAGHQLPGLIQSYDHIWLLIEGVWRARPKDGVLEYLRTDHKGRQWWDAAGGGQRKWMWRDFQGWLMSMSVLGGLRVQQCQDWNDGAAWIKMAFNWFQRTEHKSAQVVYSGKQLYSDQALLIKPSLARRVAKELPKIGITRSAVVASRFKTVEEMVNASESDWRSIDGIGKDIAKTIYAAIHGYNDR
jgi:ERCC4-type nuclease